LHIGDTGPAAVHAVSNVANPLLSIIVHYPRGQISDFQRRQLTTVDSKCVKVVSFEGGGDDMDWPIKETLLENHDNDASGGRTFCGINSYNIGRPLLQMVHFVSLIKYSLICLVAKSYLLVVPLVVKIWIYLRMAERLGIEPGDKSEQIPAI